MSVGFRIESWSHLLTSPLTNPDVLLQWILIFWKKFQLQNKLLLDSLALSLSIFKIIHFVASCSIVGICYSWWELNCHWYKKTLLSDKHVQIVFVIGNIQVAATYNLSVHVLQTGMPRGGERKHFTLGPRVRGTPQVSKWLLFDCDVSKHCQCIHHVVTNYISIWSLSWSNTTGVN